ncbi:HAMP domain-containing protein, partial [Bacillus cereus]|nr:HAMP domain-containing protein [Bacillus cereus]
IALAIGLALMLPVLRRTLVPLSRMVEAVKRIDAGNLAERFDAEQGQYEVDRLAVSFNGMLERLEHSFAAERELQMQMRRFIADASHELRTPLT